MRKPDTLWKKTLWSVVLDFVQGKAVWHPGPVLMEATWHEDRPPLFFTQVKGGGLVALIFWMWNYQFLQHLPNRCLFMSGLNQIIWKLPRKFMFFCATLIRRISSHRMFKTVDKSVLLLSGKCTVCVNSWDSLAIVHIGNWMELISNFLAFTSYILHFPNCSMF